MSLVEAIYGWILRRDRATELECDGNKNALFRTAAARMLRGDVDRGYLFLTPTHIVFQPSTNQIKLRGGAAAEKLDLPLAEVSRVDLLGWLSRLSIGLPGMRGIAIVTMDGHRYVLQVAKAAWLKQEIDRLACR